DRQLINVDGARLVRANEIEIARVEGWWRVVGIDVSAQSLVRRLLPRQLAPRIRPSGFLDWASLEPFTGHIPTIRLRVPHPKLARGVITVDDILEMMIPPPGRRFGLF